MVLRKRGLVVTDGPMADVPRDLLNADAPHWNTDRAMLRWLEVRGIEPHGAFTQRLYGPATRRRVAIESWLFASGCASDRFPRLLDWHKVKALGADFGPYQSQAADEWFAFVTVEK